jgi:hypothetical protein
MNQNPALAALSIEIGLKEIGVKEATGRNDGARVAVFQKFVGIAAPQPWCAAFMSWCVGQAAKQLGIKPVLHSSGSSTEIYHEAKELGLLLAKPQPYCIGLVKGSGGTPGKDHHHTFRVLSVDWEHGLVHSLDGNVSDQVKKTIHPISACDFVAVS